MRDCVAHILELDADAFPDKHTWKKARNMIAVALRAEGMTPAEAKEALRGFARSTRNLTPSQERNAVSDFVDWLYAREAAPDVSCARTGTMVEMGWCVGDGCKYKDAQRRERNTQRSPFVLTKWRRWKAYLTREYRNGAYVAATYEALRDTWLARELVDGQPIYIGYRELAMLVGKRMDGRARRRQSERHRMAALRCVRILEAEGLIRQASQGQHGPGRGFRRANGYVLLPLPAAPDGGAGSQAAGEPGRAEGVDREERP
ncbi:hypothetical protein ACFL09_00285 [Planctomycetota bacterium]